MSKLTKALRIRPTQTADIVRAYYYLGVAGWRLFVRRQNLRGWLVEQTAQPQLDDAGSHRMAEAALWTNRGARLNPFRTARCLQRSLALCLWLEHEGYHPALKIGARRDGTKLEAHAWVEYQGTVLNDSEAVKSMFPQFSRPVSGV